MPLMPPSRLHHDLPRRVTRSIHLHPSSGSVPVGPFETLIFNNLLKSTYILSPIISTRKPFPTKPRCSNAPWPQLGQPSRHSLYLRLA